MDRRTFLKTAACAVRLRRSGGLQHRQFRSTPRHGRGVSQRHQGVTDAERLSLARIPIAPFFGTFASIPALSLAVGLAGMHSACASR
jgi:hypothetical protein